MRTKVRMLALIVGLAIGLAGVGVASADPISCTGNQVATKTDSFWSCENAGGNLNHSGDSSNPNGNPNFYR